MKINIHEFDRLFIVKLPISADNTTIKNEA